MSPRLIFQFLVWHESLLNAITVPIDNDNAFSARRAFMNSLEDRVQRCLREEVTIVSYDPEWPEMFRREADSLRECLPPLFIRQIEHFGSTAVPGLAAKPVIDMLVEVASLRAARTAIAQILKARRYDYFWRPTIGDDVPPWYAFFIKRDHAGSRTHHIHMITRRPVFERHWEALLFRDYLISHPAAARKYEALKKRLAASHPNDRLAYTTGKTKFILRTTARAKQLARNCNPVRVVHRYRRDG